MNFKARNSSPGQFNNFFHLNSTQPHESFSNLFHLYKIALHIFFNYWKDINLRFPFIKKFPQKTTWHDNNFKETFQVFLVFNHLHNTTDRPSIRMFKKPWLLQKNIIKTHINLTLLTRLCSNYMVQKSKSQMAGSFSPKKASNNN